MPSPSSPRRALSRRTALLGAVALGTAACTPYSLEDDQRPAGDTAPTPTDEPRTDPDVPLAAAALAAEQAQVDRIDATVATHARLERVLAPTRDVHAAHVDLLAEAAPDDSGSPSSSATAGPTASASSSASAETSTGASTGPEAQPAVPRDPALALRALAQHEDELSLAGKRSAFSAESGSFARVLASMAAAAAQQATVLRATTVPGRGR